MHTVLVEDRTFARQTTAVRRAVVSPTEVEQWLAAALSEIADSLRHRGIVPNGFPFARRHLTPDGQIAVEAGFPLGVPVSTDGTVQSSTLPAGPAAVTIYAGGYDEIEIAYDLIQDWLHRRGVRPAGDAREVFHNPPIRDPEHWLVELVQPYNSG